MACALQIGLLVLGIALVRKREVRLNGQVAPAPTPFFMGLPLILQFPVCLLLGLAIGFSTAMEVTKKSKTLNEAELNRAALKAQSKYWWIDLAVPTAALAVAGVALAFGLKDPAPAAHDLDADEGYADPYAGARPDPRGETLDERRERRRRERDERRGSGRGPADDEF